MLIPTLQLLFERDLNKLKSEIELYQNEDTIWVIENDISNSAGNLCLHLIGNLNTYIGARLGNTDYLRDRDLEFSSKGIPRKVLVQAIEDTQQMIRKTLGELSENQLLSDFCMDNPSDKKSVFHYLIHICLHLSYHLGQINYHRRLLDQ